MPYKNKIIGIYKIVNKTNNKLYVGSAVNMKHRFAVHKNLLNNNKHYNKHLQLSWNKYGSDNFVFEMIIECKKEELKEYEEFNIKKYNSNDRLFGYNKRLNCTTNLGIKASDETREKLRISHLGNKHTQETKYKISKSQFKAVYQIDMDMNIINEYESIKEAADKTGLCAKSISMCTTKVNKTHPRNKYHWCFIDEFSTFEKPISKKNEQKKK